MTSLRLRLFGEFHVHDATGQQIAIAGNKPALLLAFLALRPGQAYRRSRIIDLLWPGRGEFQARGSLRQALWVLRQAFQQISPDPLVVEGETIALDPLAISTDVQDFEKCLVNRTSESLETAVAIYESELLGHLRTNGADIEAILREERERLHGLAVEASVDLLNERLKLGTDERAARCAERLLAIDPLQEIAYRTLMEHYARKGQTSFALRQYQRCREVLDRELRIAPQPETEELLNRVRLQHSMPPGPECDRADALAHRQANASPSSLQDKPSIAVLPFVNLSGDPEQEYFSDGITEDIITALSKLRWFLVIARNSTFVYKGLSVDIKAIGRELGAQYILEGSVRKAANRVRISAQLIDVLSSTHLWAQNYDRDLTDIFALQDDITQSVTAAIEPKLVAAEGVRSQSRSPGDLRAWDLVMRALTHYWRMTTKESAAAIEMLRGAVKRHPDYGPAHSLLAFALLVSGHVGWMPEGEDYEFAARLAHRAIELDNEDPWAHLALGYLAFTDRQTEESVREFSRALDLNPNFSTAYGYLGWALVFDGQSEAAIRYFEQALRMSPYDPLKPFYFSGTGVAHYYARQYDEAIEWSRRSIGERPGFTAAQRILCASLAQAGRIAETQAAMARLREIQPNVSIAWIEQHVPYTARAMPHFLDGMRKAGLA